MTFMELAAKRYSVRKYDPRPVEQEKIEQLLKAAQLAPTAKNLQPFKIYVMQSEDALAKVRKCSPLHYGAPLIFLFCYDNSNGFTADINDVNFNLEDISNVAMHVMLEATELGLGSVWVGYFSDSRLRDKFELPDNLTPAVMMPIGYAAEDVEVSPKHAETKDLSELAVIL